MGAFWGCQMHGRLDWWSHEARWAWLGAAGLGEFGGNLSRLAATLGMGHKVRPGVLGWLQLALLSIYFLPR